MQETFTDWTLVSLSPLPMWAWAVLTLLTVAATGRVVYGYRHARARVALIALRVLGALLVLGLLFEPALQLRAVRRVKNRLAVVVDRSKSMALKAEGGKERADNVRAMLNASENAIAQLQKSHDIEWYDLDGPLATQALQVPPSGDQTDLLTALERAREAGAGRPLAGFLLITDGADNAELEGKARGTLADSAKERLQRLGAPVNVMGAAAQSNFKDVAITHVAADDFAFVQNTLQIDVRLESTGMGNLTVPVTLRRQDNVVATMEVALSPDVPAHATFKTKPDKIGEFVYTVSIPEFAGEAVTSNNSHAFVVHIIRDKIRVLHVSGHPSWDERFLRQHLKENPNADLISFFILRTPTDDNSIPETELSLIPFPVQKLFTSELRSFDVVVFQDFDYRPYHMANFLPNIRDAVKEGLGFVMLGGPESFADGGYAGTALEEILPLRLAQGGMKRGVVTPTLTQAGRRHPITDLTHGTGSLEDAWNKLPAWDAANRTAGMAPGATALVVDGAPSGEAGGNLPLIAAMDVGQGRSLAIATNAMWRWRFQSDRDGGAATRAYHRFWSNALRWLVRDPEHARVRVLPDKRRYDVSDPKDVTFTVLGRDYQPIPFAHLKVTLSQAGQTNNRLDDLVAGENGVARHRYANIEEGAYRIQAQATAGTEALGTGEAVFVVESRSQELNRSAPRADLLEQVAKATHGKVVPLQASAWDSLRMTDPEVVEIDKRRNVELWDNAYALAAIVALLAGEWMVRRRSGYF